MKGKRVFVLVKRGNDVFMFKPATVPGTENCHVTCPLHVEMNTELLPLDQIEDSCILGFILFV